MSDHPFLRGVGLGMLAGAAVGATMMKNEKTIKKAAKRTVKTVGRLAEDAADTLVDKFPSM